MAIKFYHQLLKKGDAQAIFLVTSGKQTSNNWYFVWKKINFGFEYCYGWGDEGSWATLYPRNTLMAWVK